MRERSVEGSAVKWARARGWWAAKFKSPAHRGRPDHLFAKVCPSGFRPIAVEFKKLGKKSKGLQAVIIKQMEDAGWEVYKDVDTLDKFKTILALIETDS